MYSAISSLEKKYNGSLFLPTYATQYIVIESTNVNFIRCYKLSTPAGFKRDFVQQGFGTEIRCFNTDGV